jgi:NAD(P)-dependent dehydrogenase (short-subunit alcohol dehydrogenase family)
MAAFTMKLDGRVALVTGASSGLGARFARLLASAGAKVVLGARREEQLDRLADEIKAAGGQALPAPMDVTDERSVIAAFDMAASHFGSVDTVIANAGLNIAGSALEVDARAVDEIMAVNVRGVFLTVREGARRMIAAGSPASGQGRIVIVSSITASAIGPGLALYGASKAAALQLGRTLARDWVRRGINVNILCPGYMETELNAEWFHDEGGRKQISNWPRRRLMDDDALDAMLVYLCADASRHVTGSVMTIDDGQSLVGS